MTNDTTTTDPRLTAAATYVSRGWRVFVLGANKTPIGNCARCPKHNARDPETGERHDAERCGCLTCHGFYAATDDVDRLRLMLAARPDGLLAVRTGRASGIVVIDAEGDPDGEGRTGVDVLDDWFGWTGFDLPTTLMQRTTSGGVHLVYALPPNVTVRSHGRVLPQVDVKGEGGYVAVPPGAGREWVNNLDPVDPTDDLRNWLAGIRGHSGGAGSVDSHGRSVGYDYDAYVRDGCPIGARDEFANEVAFRLRKAGVPRQLAEQSARAAWAKMEQTPDDEYTWDDFADKLDRVYDTVEPDEVVAVEWVDVSPAGGGRQPEPPTDDNLPNPEDAPHVPVIGTGPENPYRATDRANGIEIARFLDRKALWIPEARVGWQWYVWDGRRWVSDKERVTILLVGEYTDQLRTLATSNTLPRDEAQVLLQRANRIESAAGLGSALKFAEPLVGRSITEFDRDPWLLNCPNGILDLRTGELRPHDPDAYLTRLCPTPYDPGARDEVWEKVLREALDDDVDRMRVLARFAGYTLTGLTSEKRFIVPTGPANSGKSTVAEAIYATLGDVGDGGYATTWDAEVVQANTQINRGEKLAKSRPARMVLVGELAKGAHFADGFVKGFTGGDTMDGKALYESSFSYRPQAKLWMATNYIPASADPALHVRLLPLPFQHVPPRLDPSIKRHLETDEGAHRAILAWAVKACGQWQEARSIGDTPWLAAEIAKYVRSSDHLQDFIEDCLTPLAPSDDLNWSAHVDEVWNAYQFWAAENVNRPLKRRKLESALDERGLNKSRIPAKGGSMRWVGYRLKSEAER